MYLTYDVSGAFGLTLGLPYLLGLIVAEMDTDFEAINPFCVLLRPLILLEVVDAFLDLTRRNPVRSLELHGKV